MQHVAMVVDRESQDRSTAGALELGRRTGDEATSQRLTLTEPPRRVVLKERNPWLTATESDETEVEEVKLFRAPLWPAGPS